MKFWGPYFHNCVCATDWNFMAGKFSLREGDRLQSQYLWALLFCFVLTLLKSLDGSHDRFFIAQWLEKKVIIMLSQQSIGFTWSVLGSNSLKYLCCVLYIHWNSIWNSATDQKNFLDKELLDQVCLYFLEFQISLKCYLWSIQWNKGQGKKGVVLPANY